MCEDCIYRDKSGRNRCTNKGCMYYLIPTEYITDCKDHKSKEEKDE